MKSQRSQPNWFERRRFSLITTGHPHAFSSQKPDLQDKSALQHPFLPYPQRRSHRVQIVGKTTVFKHTSLAHQIVFFLKNDSHPKLSNFPLLHIKCHSDMPPQQMLFQKTFSHAIALAHFPVRNERDFLHDDVGKKYRNHRTEPTNINNSRRKNLRFSCTDSRISTYYSVLACSKNAEIGDINPQQTTETMHIRSKIRDVIRNERNAPCAQQHLRNTAARP